MFFPTSTRVRRTFAESTINFERSCLRRVCRCRRCGAPFRVTFTIERRPESCGVFRTSRSAPWAAPLLVLPPRPSKRPSRSGHMRACCRICRARPCMPQSSGSTTSPRGCVSSSSPWPRIEPGAVMAWRRSLRWHGRFRRSCLSASPALRGCLESPSTTTRRYRMFSLTRCLGSHVS